MRALLLLTLLLLPGCAPLIIGGVAGYELERHRDWCRQYYGNPHCLRHGFPTAYTYRMPMGVHN